MSDASTRHPDPELLERFMRNELGPAECRTIVRHMLTGCAECRCVTAQLWTYANAAAREAAGGEALPEAPGTGAPSVPPLPPLRSPPSEDGDTASGMAERAGDAVAEALAASAGAWPLREKKAGRRGGAQGAAAAEAYSGRETNAQKARMEEGGRLHRMEERLRRIERDRRDAPALLAGLLQSPAPARLALACEEPRFRSPALCVLLLERCRRSSDRAPSQARFSLPPLAPLARVGGPRPEGPLAPTLAAGAPAPPPGPRGAAAPLEAPRLPGGGEPLVAMELTELTEVAELTVALAERLDPREWGASIVRSFAARAWTQLGNARRLARDLAGAGRALLHAELLFDRFPGSGGDSDAVERAELLCYRADLRQEQGRLEQADRLLRRALDLVRPAPLPPLDLLGDESPSERQEVLGRVLLRLAGVRHRTGAPGEASEWLDQAVAALSGGSEPRLLAGALEQLSEVLVAGGRVEEARAPLAQAMSLYQDLGDPGRRLLLDRLAGRIELSCGRLELAESTLLAAESALLQQGLGREAVLVLLDRAALYASQARSGDLSRLAQRVRLLWLTPEPTRLTFEDAMALLVLRRRLELQEPEESGGSGRAGRGDEGGAARAGAGFFHEMTGFFALSQPAIGSGSPLAGPG